MTSLYWSDIDHSCFFSALQPMFTALGAFPAPVLATALNTSVTNPILTALPKSGAPALGSAATGCVPGVLPPGIRV